MKEISVSEFFSKNRHLLGFDNPKKALLMIVKEAVDNSLDACESNNILPSISVKLEKLGKSSSNDSDVMKATIIDNGPGIDKKYVSNVFGKLLFGDKFHRLKMSRGQQGIGIAAAGMYGLLTTGIPVEVITKTKTDKVATKYVIQINTKSNDPKILQSDTIEWDRKSGTSISITFNGNYSNDKWSPTEYLTETAFINPHVEITYNAFGNITTYDRIVNEPPKQPLEIKPHPDGLELGDFINMVKEQSNRPIKAILHKELSRISANLANNILKKAEIKPDSKNLEK